MTAVNRSRFLVAVILAALLSGIAFAGGTLYASRHNTGINAMLAALQTPQVQGNTQGSVASAVGPDTIADTVSTAGPAVVKIETQATEAVSPFFNNPYYRQFFGQGYGTPNTRVQQGLGSGFMISADGYLLTNQHVIDGAQQIQVTIMGHSQPVTAQVVGSNAQLDLAVLKVNAGNNLPYLKLGDSDKTQVGSWAIAIGNPYGLDHTVTVGVIGAKGRPITVEDRDYQNLLQTDASINPGNSGGPLLNLNGEVIGINTAIDQQAQGIGFAIPSNTARNALGSLMNNKGLGIGQGWTL